MDIIAVAILVAFVWYYVSGRDRDAVEPRAEDMTREDYVAALAASRK